MPFDLDRADTICALATGEGAAALAVVRVSGRDAERVRGAVFRPRRARSVRPFVATLGDVLDEEGALIDEALCTFFPEGRSYTGEASFELSLHGGPTRVRSTLSALQAAGCRLAEPGELTLRAVLTGRLDLTAAEAVHDVVTAKTDAAARAALSQLRGALGSVLDEARTSVIEVLAELEARLDYPDEDLGGPDAARLAARLDEADRTLARLLEGAALGRRLTEGARVVLFGPPNAGKSTLLNALLGEERAIVHDTPGTTRDVLEAEADLLGVPCVLIDVAGVRGGDDVGPVEQIGIERARAELARADLVLVIDDSARAEPAPIDLEVDPGPLVIEVGTKIDLAPARPGRLGVSAQTGAGLDELVGRIGAALGAAESAAEVLLTRERQVREARACRAALAEGRTALRAGLPDEVVCAELRAAGGCLDRLLGRDLGEEVLDEVFSRFCLGK